MRTSESAKPENSRNFYRDFKESAYILIYLILGQDSGVFVSGVADNVLKFAGAIPAQSLVWIAIVLALIVLLTNRRPKT
jgi:hypothetical protein